MKKYQKILILITAVIGFNTINQFNTVKPSTTVHAKTKHTKKHITKKKHKKNTKAPKKKNTSKKTKSNPNVTSGDQLNPAIFKDPNLSLSTTDDSKFNPNPYVASDFKVGDIVNYNPNSEVDGIYAQIPTSETDDSTMRPAIEEPQCKIINKQTSSWGVVYYQLQFTNSKGWVIANDVYPVNLKVNPTNNDLNTAEQYAMHYVNYIRIQHGLQPLQFSADMQKVAEIRAKQLQDNYSHADANGNFATETVYKQLGLSNNWRHLRENIMQYPKDQANNIANAIYCVNDFTYDDARTESDGSGWGHRENILDPNVTNMGIAMDDNGYTAMEFEG